MSTKSKPVPASAITVLPAILAAACAALMSLIAAPSPASAFFGDVCLDEVVARGAWKESHASAIKSARRAWGPAAANRYGRRFADFEYSGERQFTCTWNDTGSRYRCTVSARACGPKKPR